MFGKDRSFADVNFNSSMVRLRACTLQRFTIAMCNFNSSMVRLRASYLWELDIKFMISIPVWYDWECRRSNQWGWWSTISIPVWYDWEQVGQRINPPQGGFQFQYGTIERHVASNHQHCGDCISIPVWYDWEFYKGSELGKAFSISIPVWYDWEADNSP